MPEVMGKLSNRNSDKCEWELVACQRISRYKDKQLLYRM